MRTTSSITSNNTNSNNARIEVSWAGGDTCLFLNPNENGGYDLLDYEYSTDLIHQMCGGKNYYRSCSGWSGAGYITNLGPLTRVGYYRVDTKRTWIRPEKVNGVTVLLPYENHPCERWSRLLQEHPIVLIKGDLIVYTRWGDNFQETLASMLEGKDPEAKILTRTFIWSRAYGRYPEDVAIRFSNLFGSVRLYPWTFVLDRLESYSCEEPSEKVWKIFHVSQLRGENYEVLAQTARIGGRLYATEVLRADPCEEVTEPPKGWEMAGPHAIYRVNDDEVYAIGWELAKPLYEQRLALVSRFVPEEERERFLESAWDRLPDSKYVEYELSMPKFSFFLKKEDAISEIRKGIARKVGQDVEWARKEFMRPINERKLLDYIPDDMVVRIEDSWDAGNCQPGTKEFIDRYFPGRTSCTAGELKPYAADNYHVMRVLRYVAMREKETA